MKTPIKHLALGLVGILLCCMTYMWKQQPTPFTIVASRAVPCIYVGREITTYSQATFAVEITSIVVDGSTITGIPYGSVVLSDGNPRKNAEKLIGKHLAWIIEGKEESPIAGWDKDAVWFLTNDHVVFPIPKMFQKMDVTYHIVDVDWKKHGPFMAHVLQSEWSRRKTSLGY